MTRQPHGRSTFRKCVNRWRPSRTHWSSPGAILSSFGESEDRRAGHGGVSAASTVPPIALPARPVAQFSGPSASTAELRNLPGGRQANLGNATLSATSNGTISADDGAIERVLARYRDAHSRYCAIRGTLALSLIFVGLVSSVGFPTALLLEWLNDTPLDDGFRLIGAFVASGSFAFVVLLQRRASARRRLQRVKADLDEIGYYVVRDHDWPKKPLVLVPPTAREPQGRPSVPRGSIKFGQYDRLFDPHIFQ